MIEFIPGDSDYGQSAMPDWRGRDWTSYEHDALIAGRRLHYLDAGAGECCVVLVHGLGGRWQHWARVIPEISTRRRVVALDLPGFGRSPLPDRRIDLPMLADTIAALAGELEIDRLVLVGHSFGGPLGAIFATRHPSLVQHLVLVCGTVQSFQRTLAGQLRPWITRPRTAVATIAELIYTALPIPRAIRSSVARSGILRSLALWPFVTAPRSLSPADALALIEGAGAPGVLPTARAIAATSGWERLPLKVPVTLINGDHDRIAPLADLRAYPGRVDRTAIIHGAGHLPMIEDPDAFIAAFESCVNDMRRI